MNAYFQHQISPQSSILKESMNKSRVTLLFLNPCQSTFIDKRFDHRSHTVRLRLKENQEAFLSFTLKLLFQITAKYLTLMTHNL